MFDRSVVSASDAGGAGDLAVIFDDKRRFAAIGLWDPGSPLRVKVLHAGAPATIDAGWWRGTLRSALDSGTVQRVAVALDADPDVVDGVLRDVAAQFHDTAMVATRESERRAELAALAPLLVSIPLLAGDANDVADLLEIAEHFDT